MGNSYFRTAENCASNLVFPISYATLYKEDIRHHRTNNERSTIKTKDGISEKFDKQYDVSEWGCNYGAPVFFMLTCRPFSALLLSLTLVLYFSSNLAHENV